MTLDAPTRPTAPPLPGQGTRTPWRHPNQGLEERHRRAGVALLAEVEAEGHEVLLAYFGGSLAVGLGHSLSDLDLYVVPADAGRGTTRLERVRAIDGMMVQVNVVPLQRFRYLVELASELRLRSDDRAQVDLTDRDFTELVRLVTGEAVLVSPRTAGDYARADRAVVRRLLLAKSGLAVTALSEDTAGCLASEDLRTACAAAVLAVHHGAEGLLAGADDLYVGPKFLHRRLSRCPAAQHVEQGLWDLLRGTPAIGSTLEEVERFTRDCLYTANGLIGFAMLDGWLEPLHGPVTVTRAASGPIRHHDYTLVRYSDAIGVAGPDTAFRVTPEMARLWLYLDGTAWEERRRRLLEPELGFAEQGADAALLDEALARLVAHGVVLGAAPVVA